MLGTAELKIVYKVLEKSAGTYGDRQVRTPQDQDGYPGFSTYRMYPKYILYEIRDMDPLTLLCFPTNIYMCTQRFT